MQIHIFMDTFNQKHGIKISSTYSNSFSHMSLYVIYVECMYVFLYLYITYLQMYEHPQFK